MFVDPARDESLMFELLDLKNVEDHKSATWFLRDLVVEQDATDNMVIICQEYIDVCGKSFAISIAKHTVVFGDALIAVCSEESKKLHIGSVKVSVCSTTDAIQSKANFYNNSLYEESTSGSIQFDLLMENLNEIEELLGSKENELLDRDIQLQIKQLGALKLYHACRSQNLASTPLKPDFLQLEVPVIVRSGKSQERKLKRIQASRKRVTETEPFAAKPHTNFKNLQKGHQRILSFGWRSTNRCTAKEECEFSEGVKIPKLWG